MITCWSQGCWLAAKVLLDAARKIAGGCLREVKAMMPTKFAAAAGLYVIQKKNNIINIISAFLYCPFLILLVFLKEVHFEAVQYIILLRET